MPRPKPLVSLHGAVNFDRLVPFDSNPSAPPLAANDILVMRKAAGGDNLTLSIGDITATGSVDIANLIGGNNGDMLFRRAGIWQPTGPEGLSYDGFSMILNNDNLNFQGNAQIFNAGSGAWTQSSTGNIVVSGTGNIEISGGGNFEQSGSGNIEINGGGSLMVSADGNIEIEGANAQVILSSGAEMAFEGGAGIVLENGAAISFDGNGGIDFDGNDGDIAMGGGDISFDGDGNINFDGNAGNIAMGSGQILAGPGTSSIPSISFLGDDDTGFANLFGNQITAINGGTRTWNWSAAQFNSQFSNGPALINAAAGLNNINIRPDRSAATTGISGNGAVMGLHANGNLITTYENNSIVLNGAGLSSDGGGGSGPAILNVGASASVPNIIPNQADPDTGLSRDTINGLSMVAGGLGCIRARNIGGARAVGFYTTTPIIQQTGVPVTAAGIHAACVAIGLFTA